MKSLSLACILGLVLVALAQGQDEGTMETSGARVGPAAPRRFAEERRALKEANEEGLELRQQLFSSFSRQYHKNYSVAEIPERMNLFARRRSMIQESAKAYQEGKLSFSVKENEFTDWSEPEIKSLKGLELPPKDQLEADIQYSLKTSSSPSSQSDDDEGDDLKLNVRAEKLPDRKNWRDTGCINMPRNQEHCGACYAVATMGVIEATRCIQQRTLPTMSVQQVVDCSRSHSNHGCDGGWPTRVFKYFQDKQVVVRESCYPFVMKEQSCKLDQLKTKPWCEVKPMMNDNNNNTIEYKIYRNEDDILRHVATTGPVVVAMRATDKFVYYSDGIFDDPECSNESSDVDHAISIVGYGREDGQDYWLIKNSWGTGWGIYGYGMYARGKNACSIGHWGWGVV